MATKPSASRATMWLVLCSMVAMLHFARVLLLPIALAALVAFALAPLADRLGRARIPRVLAIVLTMTTVGLFVGAIGWILADQVRAFADQMPVYREHLQAKVADLRTGFGRLIEQATSTVRDLGQLANTAAATEAPPATAPSGVSWTLVQDTLASMADFSAVAAFVFVLAFAMLLRWEDLRDRLLALAGESDLDVSARAATEAAAKVTIYLRRQFLANGLHGAAMMLILWSTGVPSPLVWGFLGAMLRFIPYLGPAISILAPVLVSLASSHGWSQAWITLGGLVGLELLMNSVLEPLLYGASGISQIALLVSAAFWTWIWGPLGLILSTPLTVCLIVIGKYLPSLRFVDVLFRDTPAMSTRARLYHRLIAGDRDEAWEILRREVADASFVEAVDQTLLPALGLAGEARVDGRSDVESRQLIGAVADALVDELNESRPATPAPPAGAARVLCFPARDAMDAVGARLAAAEFTQHGLAASAVTGHALLGEVVEAISRDGVEIVCLSSVLPTDFLHVRSLCKRFLASDPRLEIIVGLWGETLPMKEINQRLPNSPKVRVATSLAQAIATAAEIAARRSADVVSAAAS